MQLKRLRIDSTIVPPLSQKKPISQLKIVQKRKKFIKTTKL